MRNVSRNITFCSPNKLLNRYHWLAPDIIGGHVWCTEQQRKSFFVIWLYYYAKRRHKPRHLQRFRVRVKSKSPSWFCFCFSYLQLVPSETKGGEIQENTKDVTSEFTSDCVAYKYIKLGLYAYTRRKLLLLYLTNRMIS